MSTKAVQEALIELGFTFRKSHEYVTEKALWFCEDHDGVPLCSSHWKGELIWKMDRELGGVL